MKDIWKIAAPICTAAVLLGIIWAINACAERGERFKVECMRAGGSVVSTSTQDMCLQGVSVTSKAKP
jgi:hypothetical protein